MNFPTLYAQCSKGDKLKVWNIRVEGSYIVRSHGYEDCAMTVHTKEASGKNLGKSNETSPAQQALKEAQALWNKQKEKGYSETGQSNIILPMLAHDYKKRHKDIQSDFCVQPKIDGVRLIAFLSGGSIHFTSRTGKPIHNLDKIQKELLSVLTDELVYLDGELFTFSLPFDEISGLFRTQTPPQDKMNLLQYHIFDMYIPGKDITFKERYETLKKLTKKSSKSIQLVHTIFSKDKDLIYKQHDEFVQDGYEGIIIRNSNSFYKNNFRSKDLQKFKNFEDNEYEIIDGKEAAGDDAGTVIFKCKCNDSSFWVRPRGSRDYRAHLFENIRSYIGKKLTVRYQNLSEYGIPRFPVGISIRDYE